ncbi:hypothetical protein PR243_00950 [Metamycoplasma hyosynoviae]|uniref:hypothetical protein n=1 Tax=Metamycoplasma hyosynoviae TaxID=29559 RepID=UPI00235841EA|nr:hypothetical protein [Metamycoplasma hyosynoviae]MDC8937149.1 hypothetical protein [Metamycoplasma hyosynoviae]
MNKTTKIILCTAIPVGAASILIPTIVVASLKSKARKTEQDRKLLSDLNLEVQDYLGKITNEVKDTNVQQYQELLELTSKIKNVINNKYLKKEDYKKQLLLLKEKFDSFKEKINPPRKNDTNENTDNTNSENTGDVDSTKNNENTRDMDSTKNNENPDANKTNENETRKETIVSAYDQLKIEVTKAEEFYKSINGEKYIELKNNFKTKLDELNNLLKNKNLKNENFLDAKNKLKDLIDSTKKAISDKEREKWLETQLDNNSKEELKRIDEKIGIFKRNFSEIENQEKYKDNIFKELNEINKKYKLDIPVNKTSVEIKYRSTLLDEINNRYIKFKTIIDTNATQEINTLKEEIKKISLLLANYKNEISQFVNVKQIEDYLKNISEKINNKTSKDEILDINITLLNISYILDISKKILEIYKELISINFNKNIQHSSLREYINFDKNFENIFLTFSEKIKDLKSLNELTQNKYIKYFDIFSFAIKFNLKINDELDKFNKFLELVESFNSSKTKIQNIYDNKDLKISQEERNDVNSKIKEYTKEYVKSFYDISTLNELILKINNLIKNVEEQIKKNSITYIDDLEEKKKNLNNKLKKHNEVYDLNKFEELFTKLKNNYINASSDGDKQLAISKLENFFFYYEEVAEDLDIKISEYITMLKRIENLSKEYSDPKYSKIIEGILELGKKIKEDKFKNIQNVKKINFILKSLIKTMSDGFEFIKNLPNENEKLKKELKKLIDETNKSLNIEIIPQKIKTNYKKLVEEIENPKNANADTNDLINKIYMIKAYNNTFKNDFTILNKNNIYNNFSDIVPYEYSFELMNEYMIFEEETNMQFFAVLESFEEHKNITSLQVVDGFISYLNMLNTKYKEKMNHYDVFFKKYNEKSNKLLIDEINNSTNYDNATFNLSTLFTKYLIEFSHKYLDNVSTKNINHLNEMEKDLDLLIKTYKENKELTQ